MRYTPFPKTFTFTTTLTSLKGILMSMKLKIDGKEIAINEFVEKILTGTIIGAVSSLHGVKKDWKKIRNRHYKLA